MKRKKGSNLTFISRIKGDGSGTEPFLDTENVFKDNVFSLRCLSITHGTYIAYGHNSFVVKIKE